MLYNFCGCRRRRRRGNCKPVTVVTDKTECCAPPEAIAEELYNGVQPAVLVNSCYDGGCRTQYDSRRRCRYWPSFAHPRWLTCGQLYDLRHPL